MSNLLPTSSIHLALFYDMDSRSFEFPVIRKEGENYLLHMVCHKRDLFCGVLYLGFKISIAVTIARLQGYQM